jgi:hypothetical protein
MKLAKGSKLRITKFDRKATHELKTLSLSSKLSVQDKIVKEILYVRDQILTKNNFLSVLPVWKKCGRFGIFTKKINRCRIYLLRSAKIS